MYNDSEKIKLEAPLFWGSVKIQCKQIFIIQNYGIVSL
jgi:hypothetical protein